MSDEAKNGSETSCTNKPTVEFDEQLLTHIRCSRNNVAKSMITRDLATASDGYGTLLHYAATYGNATITRHLIELGCGIDVSGPDGKTALMLAVSSGRTAAMKVLLNANADIDITDDVGQSALRAALNRDYVNGDIVESCVRKLQATTRTTTELAERLVAAGGNMYHASTLVDVELLEYLLGLGVDIDSRGANGATALHVAAESNNDRVASWLIENGADVNALDIRGNSALHACAKNGSKDVMIGLLQHGADVDRTNRRDGCTPVHVAVKYMKCSERFLEGIRVLVSHRAMLETRGVSITESIVRDDDTCDRSRVLEFETFHGICVQVLRIRVFEKWSLFDLLNSSESELEMMARNEEFIAEVRKFIELRLVNSYYCKRVMQRIDGASRVVMLKNQAIPVVCKLFVGNYDECYIFARMVVDYLNVSDLEKLVVMAKTLLC